jgi:hypothetical protein
MAKPLVSNELWVIIQPLLPPHKPRRKRHPGRKPVDDRKTLTGILFVLKTGIRWQDLPHEMGCGCGMTSGDVCSGGNSPASGPPCTKCFWRNLTTPTRSIGPGRPLTAPTRGRLAALRGAGKTPRIAGGRASNSMS